MEGIFNYKKIIIFELRQKYNNIKKKWYIFGRVTNQLLYKKFFEKYNEGLKKLNQINDHINIILDLI